jgi:DNA repair protein RadA/Sms
LLQALADINKRASVLYVSGEESAEQLALRARRLDLCKSDMNLLAENRMEQILATIGNQAGLVVVIDSIQTVFSDLLQSAPGSVAQVRECAAQLVRLAKHRGLSLFLVGHVTKEGTLAGPRVLEHMVDTVLYFEGDTSSSFRVVRAMKNRFGAVNEIGVFNMTETGLADVNNPSAMFVSRHGDAVAGSVVLATQEGTRPLLVEIQTLVDESRLSNPRRVCVGLDQTRLAMLLAVLHRHAGIVTYDQDVFVNVAGGIRITETAADLGVLLAIYSSLRDKPLGNKLVVFGEVGLAGELRPVQRGQDRLKEAAKLGFEHAIVPHANRPKIAIEGLKITAVKKLQDALEAIG